MGMWASSDFFKASLNHLTSQVGRITVCTTRPATVAEAWNVSTGLICLARSSGASVSAPASTTNGWTVKSTQVASITVSNSGVADHVALLSVGATSDGISLLYVTTCTAKSLTTSDTVTIPSFNIRIADPTSS